MSERLDLDAEALLTVSDLIVQYCAGQREAMNVYCSSISALESEWQDDKTFGSMFEKIKLMRSQVVACMDEIEQTYPKYFRAKAQQIMERPEFSDGRNADFKVVEELRVPPQTTTYTPTYTYSTGFNTIDATSGVSHSDIKAEYSKIGQQTKEFLSGNIATSQYIDKTFNVLGNDSRISSVLKTSFANAPENLMAGVYRTTDRLEFTTSSNGCSFMPCGATRTAGKSVIAVDLNSKSLLSDIVFSVGRHVFYQADNDEYYELLDALKEEGNNKEFESSLEYQAYLKSFKENTPISEKYGDERTSKKAYNTASGFFQQCFYACAKKDFATIAKMEKYFPKSFSVAIRIMDKQSDALTWGG